MIAMSPLAYFWALVVSAFTGEKLEDASYQAARAVGAFANLSQQQRSTVALKASGDCQVPGYTHLSNRGYIRRLIHEYVLTMPDPLDPTIDEDEAKKRQRARDELYPAWDGNVLEIDLRSGTRSVLPDPDDRFNTSDIRAIREFGKRLIERNERAWLERLVQPEIWAIGDIKQIADFSKVTEAQSAHQRVLRNHDEEYKDAKDLGLYGPWKGSWGEVASLLSALRTNSQKIWGVRNAQLARSDDLEKESDSARRAVSQIKAEDVAIQVLTFQFATSYGDISEYVRLSPNYDDKIGWVRIPKALTHDQRGHVQGRINKLKKDPLTHTVAAATGRTLDEIASLRELFFRSHEMVRRISEGWDIPWTKAWDHLTEGRTLIDLVLEPSGTRQMLAMTRQSADKGVHKLAGARIDLPGKMFDARLVTLIAFGLIFMTVLGFNIWAFGTTHGGWAFLVALVLTVVFDRTIGMAIKQESSRQFYAMIGGLFLLILVVVVVGGWQRDGINNERRQETENFNRGAQGR